MGSIYKRGSRYWIKVRDESGRLVRKSAGRTLKDAETLLAEFEGPRPPRPSGPRLSDLSQPYLEALAIRGKPKSVESAESSIGFLLDGIPPKPVADLTVTDLNRFICQRKKTVRDTTINRDLRILNAVFNHAVEVGLIEYAPFKVKMLRTSRRKVLPILSTDEIRALLGQAKEPCFGILLVSSQTGLRLGEILHLEWTDFDHRQRTLSITAKRDWSAKSHQERVIYITASLVEYLKQRRVESRSDLIFSNRFGRALSTHNVCRGLRKVFKDAGVYHEGKTTHLLRHSAASRIIEKLGVEAARHQLGHASATTTLTYYAHANEKMLRGAAELLSL